MTDHPITPPPELVQQLCDSAALSRSFKNISIREVDVLLILEAFQAGADQELEACVKWLVANQWFLPEGKGLTTFRAVRRPKPPTLKEQALAALHAVATGANDTREQYQDLDTIRRALEALPND
jgi:hypothetical protein